jgi:hypothetical protein
MENLDDPRSHSSAMADRLISQMKIIKTRDAIATGLANPSAVRNVSKRKNTIPADPRPVRVRLALLRGQSRGVARHNLIRHNLVHRRLIQFGPPAIAMGLVASLHPVHASPAPLGI